jgi:hypothetical protein
MSSVNEIYEKTISVLSQAKELSHTLNRYMKEKPDFEETFLNEHRGKEISLMTPEGEIRGVLEDINRFRIEVNVDSHIRYYNKTALLGFYACS